MQPQEQLDYIQRFIERWEKADTYTPEESEQILAELTDEFAYFCKKENLPHMSADELYCELHEKMYPQTIN